MKQTHKILVVDDDLEDHMILQSFFDEAGLDKEIVFRNNGQQAIDLLEQIDDDELLPHLIVLDLNMPILNGIQTLLFLKQTLRFKNIPVVVFSTSENDTEKRKCLSIGAVDYLVKPLTMEEGKQIIGKFLAIMK